MTKEETKAYMKVWWLAHKEQTQASKKAYYQAHCEHLSAYQKVYRLAHLEQVAVYNKAYRLTYPEQIRKQQKVWYLANLEQVKKTQKAYNQTPIGKRAIRKHNAKRKQLGFIPLNDWFEGSVGHHIDKEQVIYMPVESHNSIGHSVLQNRNMTEINNVAYKYLTDIDPLKKP